MAFFDKNSNLTYREREGIEHSDNEIYLSHYSIMEIAINKAVGKLDSVKHSTEILIEEGINKNVIILPSLNLYTINYANVPLFDNHRDPFDRFIIAIAKTEGLYIMTSDEKFKQYDGFVHLWQ